jgi:imidazolonepropionase-like amidohydrolase
MPARFGCIGPFVKHAKPTRRLVALFCSTFASAYISTFGAAAADILPPGFRPVSPGVHALAGATVFTRPGNVLSNATILIRDGFIEEVITDTNVALPPDARVWDLKGLTVYAGFIDPYLSLEAREGDQPKKADRNLRGGGINFYGVAHQETDSGGIVGPGYEVALAAPERRIAATYQPDPKALEKYRGLGFTAANVVPQKGILRGTSAFVALSDEQPARVIIKPDVFQHVALDTDDGRTDVYPASLMGFIAVVRQSFFDAQHYALDQADYLKHPGARQRPEYNKSDEALALAIEHKMPVVFEPKDALMVDRSARIAHELNLDFLIVSTGEEWRRPDLAKSAAVPFIVPLNFPELPKLPEDDDWEQVTLDELRAWDWAPENAAVLQNLGLQIALTTHGLADEKDFRKNLALALDRGLAESNALAALTVVPARLCGLEKILGTIEPGKQANLTIVDGKGYFDPEAKVNAVWIDGKYYPMPVEAPKDKDKTDKSAKTDAINVGAVAAGTNIVADASISNAAVAIAGTNAISGSSTNLTGDGKKADEKKKEEEKLAKKKELQKRLARAPLEGRGVLTNPPAVLVRNATIWTCGPAGKMEHADLLVEGGKIKSVSTNIAAPTNALVIDGTGLHVTPGLIDCHSHSFILGDVNEGTLPSSAMVRIGDVVNSESDNIYEQLAGGLTEAHLLHGSANPIGGQNCLVKLRDGETPEGMKFTASPGSIKFALGENVKQSNWGEKYTTRFPQSRTGVQTFFQNRFIAARQYLQQWADYQKSGGLPPRRDLELEALGEILEGKRFIHCHSYRQDEILMLMRLMEGFGVHIGTFQHVLEGYKIADEIAKDGAGGSTFADWWAYKFEVYDAIPYNGSLMRDRGVLVSFNSDSDDLARRLNTEAAKAVKFGGTPEIEALKFVTINPAIQLKVDKLVGSLEPGKDADFVLWSKAPLDSLTVCQQTWIEGKKYFDVTLAPARAEALEQEYAALKAKAKKLADPDAGGDEKKGDDQEKFFRKSLEHLYDGRIRHCLDEENE